MGFWDWFSSKSCQEEDDDVVYVGVPANVTALRRRLEGKLKKYLEYRIGDYLNTEIYKVEGNWSKGKQDRYIREVTGVYKIHESYKQISFKMDINYWNRVYNSFMSISKHTNDKAVPDVDNYRVVENRKRKCLWCHESVALIHHEILESGYQGKYEIVECGQASGSGHWIVVLGREDNTWDNIRLANNDVVIDIWGRLHDRYYDGIKPTHVTYTGKEARQWGGKKNVRTRVDNQTDVLRTGALMPVMRHLLRKQREENQQSVSQRNTGQEHRKPEVIEITHPERTGLQNRRQGQRRRLPPPHPRRRQGRGQRPPLPPPRITGRRRAPLPPNRGPRRRPPLPPPRR